MKKCALFFALWAVSFFCACSSQTKSAGPDRQAKDAARMDSVRLPELSLPEVPLTLTDPVKRADYIMEHFWDALDFRDTLRSHNRMFMEQSLVNFISLFPHGRKQALPAFMGNLLKRARNDSTAFGIVTDVMERYLNDPNSPMRNEDYYILFLQEYLRLPGWSEYDRMRPAYQLETALKNRPGSTAADFAYLTRDGRRGTLHGTPVGGLLLLLFYDPACGHCTEILQGLRDSPLLGNLTKAGVLSVLAVYTEGDRALWERTRTALPQEWTVAIDLEGIVEQGIYDLPAMPVLYLLDADKSVLLKDPTPQVLEAYLQDKAH